MSTPPLYVFLIPAKEAADILGGSSVTLKNWRTRKLLGYSSFDTDEKHGDTWYYERVEQLKEVYHKGILQNMYKLARKFAKANPNLSDDFQKTGKWTKDRLSLKIPAELGTDLKALESQLLSAYWKA